MDAKTRAVIDRRKFLFAYLDRRIPELHREGVPGRLAREQAAAEFAASLRR